MSRDNALVAHLRRAAQRKHEMIQAGELPASARGGRPGKPTVCPRCGQEQPTFRAAFAHCRQPHGKLYEKPARRTAAASRKQTT
jgi:hypothetical protein